MKTLMKTDLAFILASLPDNPMVLPKLRDLSEHQSSHLY